MPLTKKISFLTVAFLAVVNLSFGQRYSVFPNDTFVITWMMEDMATLTIYQANTTKDTITLAWEKLSESVPENWDASVCDNKICYTTLVNSGTMNPVLPGDSGFILLHITPHVNFGIAIVRYVVWDTKYPILKDTLTYMLSVENASGIDEINAKKNVYLYPSYTTHYLNIANPAAQNFTYRIADITGKSTEIPYKASLKNGLNTIDVSCLKNGLYILQLIPESTSAPQKIHSLKFIKQ